MYMYVYFDVNIVGLFVQKGGLIVLKLLESMAFRDSIAGVVLLCSVPPSG